MVGQKLTYTTTGHDPLDVHEFQYDWGDGTRGDWKSSPTQSHTYQLAGIYYIKVREKCPLGLFETDWSGTTKVTITGSVGDAWLLSVSSSPVAGVAISGTAPGKTDYTALIPKGSQVTLTAPSTAIVKGTSYTFQNWALGGVPQAAGLTTLAFQITADINAQAVYLVVQRNLTVQSSPIIGVAIAGSEGGMTNYSTEVPDNTSVTLTAPFTFTDGGPVYGFTGWTGPGAKTTTSVTRRFRITSDTTLSATYGVIEMSVIYPSDAGIILERGTKVSVWWEAVNLPKGFKVKIQLVKGGTQVWTLSEGTTKSPFRWTVGAPIAGAEAYPDGDDYKIRVGALDGAVSAESQNPFAIATVQSLFVNGPTTVQGGTQPPPQYTCTAHYSFGGDRDVTSLVKWRCSPTTYAKISKTGLLTTKRVPSDQPCAITATYGNDKSPLSGGLQVTLTP